MTAGRHGYRVEGGELRKTKAVPEDGGRVLDDAGEGFDGGWAYVENFGVGWDIAHWYDFCFCAV